MSLMSSHVAIGVGIAAVIVGTAAGSPQQTVIGRTPPVGEIIATRAVMTVTPTRSDLWVMQPDGSRAGLMVRNAGEAAVTRDGKRIAFVRAGTIWVMNRNGSGQKQVTTPPHGAKDADPAWAPNGVRLYFSRGTGSDSSESTTSSIFSVGPEGSVLRRLTHASPTSGFHHLPACHVMPSVSPDGQRVVYTLISSCSHTADWSLAAVTTAGRPTRIEPTLPAWSIEPEFSGGRGHPRK